MAAELVIIDGPIAGTARLVLMVRRKLQAASAPPHSIVVNHGWHKKSFEDFAGEFSSLRLAAACFSGIGERREQIEV